MIKQQLGEINEEAQFLSTEATKVVIYQAQPPPEHLRGRYPSNLIRYAGIYLAGLLEARYQNTSTAVVQLAIQALLLHLVSDAFNDGWCGPDVIGMSNVLKRTSAYPVTPLSQSLYSNFSQRFNLSQQGGVHWRAKPFVTDQSPPIFQSSATPTSPSKKYPTSSSSPLDSGKPNPPTSKPFANPVSALNSITSGQQSSI